MRKQDILLHITTCVLSVCLGLGLGYAFFSPHDAEEIKNTADQTANEFEAAAYAVFSPDVVPRIIEQNPGLEVFTELAEENIFLVSSRDGLIVVYYAPKDGESASHLRTITNISTAALPQEEQERLAEGIAVYSEDELLRLLEDYSS